VALTTLEGQRRLDHRGRHGRQPARRVPPPRPARRRPAQSLDQELRFRLFEVPGRITFGQRKTWLHLPADWPWTPDLTASWQTIKTLPIPI
jgi:hypothetical protein